MVKILNTVPLHLSIVIYERQLSLGRPVVGTNNLYGDPLYYSTVDSRYNEPRREMKISSLYREFVKSKMEKIGHFCANINSYLRVVKLYIFFPIS